MQNFESVEQVRTFKYLEHSANHNCLYDFNMELSYPVEEEEIIS
jgi:hypothetical protein